MLTQKKKVMDIDTMLEKCSLKKRNYSQARMKVEKILPNIVTEMERRDSKPLIESYYNQIFTGKLKEFTEIKNIALMISTRSREKGTMGARHKQTISLICLYTGVYF